MNPISSRQLESPTATITVAVRLFARYAEALGRESVSLTLAPGATVSDALAQLRRELPAAATLLPARPLCAVRLEHVGPAAVLQDGDELALLPPSAGG